MSRATTRTAQKGDRTAGTAQVKTPARVQQARKAGHHGKQTDAEGNNNALPKKHSSTKDLTIK